jgi:uncharacterized membrane protein YhaH (DUF805 family)
MTLIQLLFGFKGRIRRLHWWVAALAVGAVSGVLTSIVETAAGGSAADPESYAIERTGVIGVALLLVALANSWINFAISVKRLHDRVRSAWWLVWQVLALSVAVIAVVFVTALVTAKSDAAGLIAVGYVIAGVSSLAALVISIWLFVEIGFLRGTPGPNRFGPDPLGAAGSDAKL